MKIEFKGVDLDFDEELTLRTVLNKLTEEYKYTNFNIKYLNKKLGGYVSLRDSKLMDYKIKDLGSLKIKGVLVYDYNSQEEEKSWFKRLNEKFDRVMGY